MPNNFEVVPIIDFTDSAELERLQSPAEYYSTLYRKGVFNQDNVLYISGPLNHLGAHRINPDFTAAFAQNEDSMQFYSVLISQDSPDTVLAIPSILKKMPAWGQFHYNFFWLCIISGIKPEVAQSAYQRALEVVDYKLMNDRTQKMEEKAPEYNKLIGIFNEFWKSNEVHPVKALIQLPDGNNSLGGATELQACKMLRIPVYYPTLNQSHPDVTLGIESTVLGTLAVQNDALLPINPPVSITLSPLEKRRVLFDGANGT